MNAKTNSGRVLPVLVGVVVLIVVLGIAIYFTIGRKDPAPRSRASFPPVVVELLTVTPEALESRLSAVGSIHSNESVVIKPEVAGKVRSIGFEEGDNVEEGKVLFELDSEILDAEYQEVKANYDYASRQYERAKKLKKDGVMPVEEFDERLRAFLNAKSRLNTLSTRLNKHKIVAPFSGRIGARRVSIGDYLSVGDPMVHLEDLSLVKVEFYLPQRYIRQIHRNQLVRVTVEPFVQVYEGSIYLIDPRIDPESRSAVIRAKVANPEEVLNPGMFCTVEIVVEKKENGLMVPEQALVSRGERHFLYLEKDGNAVMREVSLGLFLKGKVEISEGLNAGERVIVAGIQKLAPGAKVQELKSQSPQAE